MEITVRDNRPDIGPGVVDLGNGAVRANVDDGRFSEIADFMNANRSIVTGGRAGAPWGRTTAKDATEALTFAINQLAYLESKSLAKWYEPITYETVLEGAIDTSAGPGAKSVDYIVTDGTGQGEFIGPSSSVPMVDIANAKVTIAVALAGIGYGYTYEDLRTAAYTQQPLSARLQEQAVLGYRRHANKIALLGDSTKNFTGLYSNASVTAANRSSGAVWDAATADTIVNDILLAYAAYVNGTKNNEKPSKIVFPLTTRQLLWKRVGSSSDTTIDEFIKRTLNVDITDDPNLETAGAGTTKRVVFCNPKNDNVVFHVPKTLEFIAPQFQGFNLIVLGDYKLGGFEVRRIQSVRYMDAV